MNYKLRLFLSEMIDVLQRFLVAYCIITVFLYQTSTSAPLYCLGLVPVPFLSYLIERKAKRIWSFVLLHCAILPMYLIAAYSFDSAVLFSIYILLTAVATYYTKNNHSQSNILYLLIVFLLFYVGTAAAKLLFLSHMIFFLAVLFTLLHFLRLYLNNFTLYFQAHSSITNIPIRQIKNTNNSLMIFLGLLCLFVILISSGLPLTTILMQCVRTMLSLLYLLVNFFMRKEPDKGSVTVRRNEQGLSAAKSSPLLQLIFKIAEWLILIVLVVALILLVTWSIYKIYQYFYRRNKHEITDLVEFISPFAKKEASKKASSQSGMKRFGRSNNAAIRKLFYQAVTASVEDISSLEKDLTPTDLAGLLKVSNPGDTPEVSAEQKQLITRCYEKARYSNLECSKEEVRRMKQMLK